MPERWQYQVLAEPLSESKEAVGIDKWQGNAPEASLWKRTTVGVMAAIVAGSCFLGDVPRAQAVTIDKWQGNAPDIITRPRMSLPSAIQAGSFFLDPKFYEQATIDKWIGDWPDTILRNKSIPASIQAGSSWLLDEQTTLDKWIGDYPDTILKNKSIPASIQAGSSWLLEEQITLDKWAGNWPDILVKRPGRSVALRACSDFFEAPIAGTPAPDYGFTSSGYRPRMWQYQALAEPVSEEPGYRLGPDNSTWRPSFPDLLLPARGVPAAIEAGHSFFIWQPSWSEEVTCDKWTGDWPDIINQRRGITPAIQAGALSIVQIPPPILVPLADKWLGQRPDILFRRPILSQAIQAGTSFLGDIPRAEAVRLDKWIGDWPDLIMRPKGGQSAAVQSGSLFYVGQPIANAEPVSIDKWVGNYPVTIDRRSPLPAAIQAGCLFYQRRFEQATIDKWSPLYPCSIDVKEGESPAIQAGYLFLTEVAPLQWRPEYPDLLLARPGVIAAIQAGSLFYQERYDQVTLDRWLPTFPDRLYPVPYAAPSEEILVWAPAPSISISAWLPIFPDRLYLPLRIATGVVSCFDSNIPVKEYKKVHATFAWRFGRVTFAFRSPRPDISIQGDGMDQVNELTSAVATISFKDENKAPVTPTSARYRIDDTGAKKQAIVPWTDIVTLAPSIDILITADQNALIYEGAYDLEYRLLTVIYVYGIKNMQSTAEEPFTVKNLKKVP